MLKIISALTDFGFQVTLIPLVAQQWHEIVQALNLSGMSLTLAQHCVLEQSTESQVVLTLDQAVEDFYNAGVEAKLAQALSAYYQRELNLKLTDQCEASCRNTESTFRS